VGNTITGIGGEDIEITILNAPLFDKDDDNYTYYRSEYFEQYDNRNNRSLSLHLKYKDFVCSMGGDTYQHAQRAVLNTFGDKVRAHIYHANHHFHGGVLQEYLELLDRGIAWAGELGMYVIIDWHTIGNPITEVFYRSLL